MCGIPCIVLLDESLRDFSPGWVVSAFPDAAFAPLGDRGADRIAIDARSLNRRRVVHDAQAAIYRCGSAD